MFSVQDALNRLIDSNEIYYDEMTDLMRQIMRGEVCPEAIAAILIGLRIKVESNSEIVAATNALREFMVKVPAKNKERLVDIVGTGGDNAQTFNISTAAMFVAGSMGALIAKHGNRAVTSKSGAADAVEQMGACIELGPEQIAQSIEECGVGFMFAQMHHAAMKYVAPVRKALGVRTMFNILGCLANPTDAANQVLGVFHPDLLSICAHASKQMGRKRVIVAHGCDGLDEITVTGPTRVAELKDGEISYYEIEPERFGIKRAESLKGIRAGSPKESVDKIMSALNGDRGPHRDVVLLNAAACLYCVGIAKDLGEGVEMAAMAIDSGKALAKQKEFVAETQKLAKETIRRNA